MLLAGEHRTSEQKLPRGLFKTNTTTAVLILIACVTGYVLAGGVARYVWGSSINNMIAVAVLAVGLPLLLLILFRPPPEISSKQKNYRAELAEALLHSTSPMVLATAMDGSFTYLNPSAERIL